ncbi:MAG: D-2-hydroxyacid dehydrogenase [Saccharofermentanales bacterium]
MIISLAPLNEDLLALVEKKTGERPVVYDAAIHDPEIFSQADIIIGWSRLTLEAIQKYGNLKWLFVLSAGVENLPFDYLQEKGIILSNTQGIHRKQMAEQTLGLMIMFSRRLNKFFRAQADSKWLGTINPDELTGKTLCIIGAGSIGSEIARKAYAFDMKVIGIKKTPVSMDNFDVVAGVEMLHDALSISDYNVLITPLTPETTHMIGEKEFKAMKETSIFINMSRGDTVDEAALISALQSGEIAGAGLDVFHEEPLPETSPLWQMENVIITPHMAGKSPHYMTRAMEIFCSNLLAFRRGETDFPNKVDLSQRY